MIKTLISLFAKHGREVRRTTIGDPLVGLTKHINFEAQAVSIDRPRQGYHVPKTVVHRIRPC